MPAHRLKSPRYGTPQSGRGAGIRRGNRTTETPAPPRIGAGWPHPQGVQGKHPRKPAGEAGGELRAVGRALSSRKAACFRVGIAFGICPKNQAGTKKAAYSGF